MRIENKEGFIYNVNINQDGYYHLVPDKEASHSTAKYTKEELVRFITNYGFTECDN